MSETTQEERDHARDYGLPPPWEHQFINDAYRLATIEPDYDRAMCLIRMCGVPEQRAERLSHALYVLLTRLDREIQSHRAVESAIERQVRELADKWNQQQFEYPDSQEGEYAAAAVRCCARELRAILDPEGD